MYGYITVDGLVGEIYEIMPPDGVYHPSYKERILQLPEGATSGWRYIGGEFLPPQEPEPEISAEQRIALLEADNALKTAQLKAAQESNKFMEDCMVEMAEILYA